MSESISRTESTSQSSGTSEFAGLNPEERGELAAQRLGTPKASALDIAGNVVAGGLQALADIPAGAEQIAVRGAGALGILPES
ncbi:MAG: hypothetical protein L0312_12815, partial [Acidobacteria bacterium]|nr:hypothetical protein [Acidobacteriota bacterium]